MDFEDLKKIRERNNEVNWMICDYLNDNARFITLDLMSEANPEGILSEETTYTALFSGACGIDIEDSRKSIKKLDTSRYLRNPFYADIRIQEVRFGEWELKYQEYAPYEAFIRDDIVLEENLREIPQIGFFNEKFRFPSVMEKGHEWMSIKPSEVETLESSLHAIHGKVVTFGLGLGYYTYMASRKSDVSSITVVERDTQVIALFTEYILPQFSNPEKVNIVTADAFEYAAEVMPSERFDYAMVDIWHDTSDGLEPYLEFKKLERRSPSTIFHYWAEESLLSAYRWKMFDLLTAASATPEEAFRSLQDSFLRKLASR